MVRLSDIQSSARVIFKKLLLRFRGYRIHELPEVNVSFRNERNDSRINLILLGVRKNFAFGGTDTAVRFFDAIYPYYRRSRIIVLGEDNRDHDQNRWPERKIDSRSPKSPHTIAYLKEKNLQLVIENDCDHFIATHWITAHYLMALREAQRKSHYLPSRPFVYLIQDFEPGFYPWSSRYLLANSTYMKPDETIAVFNTELLKEYFEAAGYAFPQKYVFEPALNPILAAYKDRIPKHRKQRLMLVYGRPSAARNAFELIVETLRIFAERYEDAQEWDLLSLGETHREIQLPKGLVLRTEGKVTLDRYAEHLLDASVGFALMVSPHPSYPPLEMAEFGVRVVTNNFANKNLSKRSQNIVGVSDTQPIMLADALMDACRAHDNKNVIRDLRPAFLGFDNEFSFSGDLAQYLLTPNTPISSSKG